MKKYEKKTLISCPIEKLFAFHLDSNNIQKITPKDTKVELLNKNFVAKEGEVLNIKTTKFFIPTIWSVEISLIKEPNMLVDKAIKSSFSFWRHSHIFTKKGDVCELKDVVEYELPFGFLGNIFSGFMENQLENMFEYRHKQTKKLLQIRD